MSGLLTRFAPLARDIDKLEKMVVAREKDVPTHTKRTAFYASVAMPVDLRGIYGGTAVSTNPFNPQEKAWQNGADDVHITEVGWTGFAEADTALGIAPVYDLQDAEHGVVFGDQNAAGIYPVFDFEWNYRLPRTGQLYVSAMNGATYASRKAFGIVRGNRVLNFMDPLLVKSGDSLTWMMKPVLLNPLLTTSGEYLRILTIEFWMSGYRNGTQAEADYERP